MIKTPKEIAEREQKQRLANLEIVYFRLQMDLVAYEANEDIPGAERVKEQIISCEKSYEAIRNMLVE